jgi:Fe-S-cluster containining protein
MTDRSLRMLYREVPAVSGCKPGCGRCCGPVPWSAAELARVEDRIPSGTVRVPAPGGQGHVVLVHPLTTACAMLAADKSCTVYEARPLMCRLFGAVDAEFMTCQFGAKAARPLSDKAGHRLVDRYKALP